MMALSRGGPASQAAGPHRLPYWERHTVNNHPDAEIPFKAWRRLIRAAQYKTRHEAKRDFPAADFPGGRVTVFDIGGNKYRLVVTMRYDLQRVYIRHVLTHSEYDRKSRAGDL
jgi:mRNA interferase HigB